MSDGTSAMGEAAMWLGGQLSAAPNDVAAGSSPFMRLAGVVVGGWLLARSAAIAASLLAAQGKTADQARNATASASAGPSSPQFLADKIATARFYADQILPSARGLVPAATGGAELFYAIPAERL